MVASFDWGLLIVAASGTICAIIAMVKVFRITGRLEGLLSMLPKNPLKMITPKFVADTITEALVGNIKTPDGGPVTVPDLIDSYMMKYGPPVWARVEAKLPELAQIALNPDSPQTGQSPGKALAGQRWGGGLKAAQATVGLAKAVKSPAIVEKIQQGIQVVQAVKDMVPAINELREGFAGGNGNDSGPGPSTGSSQSGDVWCPQ